MADTCVCGHPRESHIFEPYTFISPCDECECEQFRPEQRDGPNPQPPIGPTGGEGAP